MKEGNDCELKKDIKNITEFGVLLNKLYLKETIV